MTKVPVYRKRHIIIMWLKVLFAELLQNSNMGRSTQNCYIFRLLPWVSSWSHRYVILTGRSFFCLTLLLDFIVIKGREKTLGIFACWSSCWPLFSYYWSKFKTDKFKNPGYRRRCVSNWRPQKEKNKVSERNDKKMATGCKCSKSVKEIY